MPDSSSRAALVTGVSREAGIGRRIVQRLAADGFRVASAGWPRYDERMPWGSDRSAPDLPGPTYEVDLEYPEAASGLIPRVNKDLGPIGVLVLCHTESVDSDIRGTSVESFDRHMAVNARASWQLIRAFSEQFAEPAGLGRIIALTSDHTAGNLPYGASKGALDRIVIAAATELADQGVTANVINPGATDTGWMTAEVQEHVRRGNLQPRLGLPADVANLVSFLCSPEGQWINAQTLHSDGGRRRT